MLFGLYFHEKTIRWQKNQFKFDILFVHFPYTVGVGIELNKNPLSVNPTLVCTSKVFSFLTPDTIYAATFGIKFTLFKYFKLFL